MKYLTFAPETDTAFDICFLSPTLDQSAMERLYITPHLHSLRPHCFAYSLKTSKPRTPVKDQRAYLDELIPILKNLGTKYLIVCQSEYFKLLTKEKKAEPFLGHVLDSSSEYPGFKVIYAPYYQTAIYHPQKVQAQVTQALYALNQHIQGTYQPPGQSVIHSAYYPSTVDAIKLALQNLLDRNCDLTADIETFSLKHYDAGIGTVAFAWNQHEGIAFPVDLLDSSQDRYRVRALLKEFFIQFFQTGNRMIWHNISFDVYVLIYQLFMEDLIDTKGLLEGLEIMLNSFHCTKLISYLATNSCAGNSLGLKDQSQEFVGNYAIDVKDITKVPLPQLLEYNLLDCLATWFVFHKNYPILKKDDQLKIYNTIFKPSVLEIIQMQLTGFPVNMRKVELLQQNLIVMSQEAFDKLQSNAFVDSYIHHKNKLWVENYNNTRKVKRVTIQDAKESFNPASPVQLQQILYDPLFMDLPVIDYTDSKLPSTSHKTLNTLKNHTTNDDVLEFLEALIQYKAIRKYLSDFVKNFLKAVQAKDGHHYFFGNFNLGGTVSGRLSSSEPNMQNLPAGGRGFKGDLAKMVKECFEAPEGWLFVGLDFASLEDRISALLTKDPNKLKVYTDGFDGHSLRAYSYFADQITGVDPSSVDSINSIKNNYPQFREESKIPTFLLTYGGTHHGIQDKMGWSADKAKAIEARYHELYAVSDQWVADQIQQATQTGYVTVAFGLRVRTPLLSQVVLDNSKTPYEAKAEARTAGNACGQSWGLLNNRAATEFMTKVRMSKHRLNIRPCAHIHDAQYYLIRNNLETLLYVNTNLVKAVEWQNDPAIWHDAVKLGGSLAVYFPTWANSVTIPNYATASEIEQVVSDYINSLD